MYRCEYCGVHQDCAASMHQVDHVLSRKHQGSTSLENLALSCITCNRRKASDIASRDPATGALSPLFNPRTQRWRDHFTIDGAELLGLTAEARTTIEFLRLNSFDRVAERAEWIRAGRYP